MAKTINIHSPWALGAACAATLLLTACQPDTPKNPVSDQATAPNAQGAAGTRGGQDDMTRDFALANFTSIELNGIDDVTTRQGEAFAVRAKGRQQDLAMLDLRVEAGRLIIGRKGAAAGAQDDVDIDITVPTLHAVTLRGAGDMDVEALSGDVISAEVVGAGALKIKRLTGTLAKLSILGAGDLDVERGEIDKGEYRQTGAGDLDVEKLIANDVTVTSSGAGSVKGHASRTAKVTLLGAGDVEIKGGATCQISKQGAGKIRC
jgi:hypothetical protein